MRNALSACCIALTLAHATPAEAQKYMYHAAFGMSSGIEAGEQGATAGARRARTTMRLGADIRIDESPRDILGVGALVEVEPRSALGVDGVYQRRVGTKLLVGGGAIGFLAPSTLFGVTLSSSYQVPVSSGTCVVVGPVVNGFFLGRDLPDETIVWQALVRAGVVVDLF